MPTQKVLKNIDTALVLDFVGDPGADPPVPPNTARGTPSWSFSQTLFEAKEPCTISGLRWELDYIHADEPGNFPWGTGKACFVVLPQGVGNGTHSTQNGDPPYRPVEYVIGWSNVATVRNGTSYANGGKSTNLRQGASRAQRRLKPGDRVVLDQIFKNEWGVPESVTQYKMWTRGIVQFFIES